MAQTTAVSTRQSNAEARPMNIEDAEQAASVYLGCFPKLFLSGMGKPFLTRYFRHIAADPESQVTVLELESNQRIVGIAASTTSETLYKDVIKSAPLTSIAGVAVGLLRSAAVREQFLQSGRVLKRIMRTKGVEGADAIPLPAVHGPVARGIYIAVLPEGRGRGNADRLLNAYSEAAFADGAVRIVGSIQKTNMPSVILHKRNGWQFQAEADHHHVWKDAATAPTDALPRTPK